MRQALPILFIILLCATAAIAQPEVYSVADATLQVRLGSQVRLLPRVDNARIDEVNVFLLFVPQEGYGQSVSYVDTTPPAQRTKDAVHFSWMNPQERTLSYEVRSKVQTSSVRAKVYTPVAYPVLITDIPDQFRRYIDPTETIDSDDSEIRRVADNLARGESDLWSLTSKVAIWTSQSVAYNLSTLTADVSEKASWVLENRYGVCDEITSLFIALMRALGVPARFVSGVAFTDSPQFPAGWGAHGWAEVYFPFYGWVPFDPTFGQLGWIDPGHIVLRISDDPATPSTRFEWRGRDMDLEADPLNITASIVSLGQRESSVVHLEADLFRDDVGFGSANLVTVKVTNLRDYYVTTKVSLANVNEMEALDGWDRQVIIEPKGVAYASFRIQIKSGLDPKFQYTLPILAYTQRNESARTQITATSGGRKYSLIDVTRAESLKREEESKQYSTQVRLACIPLQREFYADETASVNCTLQNPGETPLRDVQVCLRGTCKSLTAPKGSTVSALLDLSYFSPGVQEYTVTAKNDEISKSATFEVDMLDRPAIGIIDVAAPDAADYGSTFNISFTLNRTSHSTPEEIRVVVSRKGWQQEFTLDGIVGRQPFVITMHGSDLGTSDNQFKVVASWKDLRGRGYGAEQRFTIKMGRINVLQRSWVFVREFGRNLWANLKWWD